MKLVKSKIGFFITVAIIALVFLIIGVFVVYPSHNAYAAEVQYGSGESGDVYLISSAVELKKLSETSDDW
ncbi:MAG: hypothetical protein J1F39_06490, partial [Clostridiales bacterium]|nr:hypothetical protein [Clostridiales bacterium]